MEFDNMLTYCRELEMNNNRPWFHANHKQYETAKSDFTELVERVKFAVVDRVEPELRDRLIFADPKDMLYRIPRDARVYKDKPPYNPTWRAYISPDKKSLLPLSYIMRVAPYGQSHFGCGAWCPDGDYLRRMRDYIAEHWEELDELLDNCGLPLLAMAVITNMGAGVLKSPLTTDEVDETAQMVAGPFSEYMKKIVAAI